LLLFVAANEGFHRIEHPAAALVAVPGQCL